MRSSFLLAAALAGAAVAQPPADPDPASFEEIVVRARPGPPAPLRDAIDYYRSYCFDANRRTGRSAPPVEDSDWQPLDEAMRRRFGVGDPDSSAFGLADRGRERTLLMKFERFARPGGLIESRCTLVILGGRDHAALVGQMSALFRGPGTERHVGERDGSPRIGGWRQWLWTGMPQRRSRDWRVVASSRSTRGGTWVVVTDPSFYDSFDYVLGDLKIRQSGRPLSVLSFAYTTRASGR